MKLYKAIESLMDNEIITDWANEYGEPGYNSTGPITELIKDDDD